MKWTTTFAASTATTNYKAEFTDETTLIRMQVETVHNKKTHDVTVQDGENRHTACVRWVEDNERAIALEALSGLIDLENHMPFLEMMINHPQSNHNHVASNVTEYDLVHLINAVVSVFGTVNGSTSIPSWCDTYGFSAELTQIIMNTSQHLFNND